MTRPSIYTRPNKPMTIPVRDRRKPAELKIAELPELVAVDKATECHVTPLDVARRMVEYLGPVGDYLTLEPSAGTGQLARALLDSGHSPYELCVIERHAKLASGLRSLKCAVVNECFLEYAEKWQGRAAFPRIIMNPPFSQVRKHMAAAISLLDQCGHQEPATLVALVPVTWSHDDAEELERLPVDTFPTAKVYTKIIRIRKPL